jgi:DNA modification methylase
MLTTFTIHNGDSLTVLKTLPSNYVHCVCTSPPYYGLRDYGCSGQMGLEATLEEFLERMVELFREVRRVLRPDGTCWINMGDAYAQQNTRASRIELEKDRERAAAKNYKTGAFAGYAGWDRAARTVGGKLKPKDLIGQPWRLALALQADGWWLRSDIIWNKSNPLPESCKDRPSKSHEYIFLLTKSSRYFYDAEAVKEPLAESTMPRLLRAVGGGHKHSNGAPGQKPQGLARSRPNGKGNAKTFRGGLYTNNTSFDNSAPADRDSHGNVPSASGLRNKRTVWTFATEPFSARALGFENTNHFATFPLELPLTCIKAGTSARGVCAACGKPWKRIVDPSPEYARHLGKSYHDHSADQARGMMQPKNGEFRSINAEYVTVGWQPTCQCEPSEPVPALVLDPFAGAGTTLLAANQLGRHGIGIELNSEYCRIAERRLIEDAPLLVQGGIK